MSERFLMCAPEHFEVSYVINPWMEGNVARAHRQKAWNQWQRLAQLLGRVAHVERIAAAPVVPDMVFTANAGLVLGNRFVPSNFRYRQRQPEQHYFVQWFAQHGFELLMLPQQLSFEGAGDALLDRASPLLWLGHGHRSDLACAEHLSAMLKIAVQPLRLVDERFYHLDTCFCPLEGGYLMYYPDAFDAASLASIEARIPATHRIIVGAADAFHFACNAINCGRHIVLNRASAALAGILASHGFTVQSTPLTEFIKAGGSAKCLTLRLTETLQAEPDHKAA